LFFAPVGDTSKSRCSGLSAHPEIRLSGLSSRLSTCGGCTYRRGSTGDAETCPPTQGPTAAPSAITATSPAAAPAIARPRSLAETSGTSACAGRALVASATIASPANAGVVQPAAEAFGPTT
jgi:hypothetical protein